MEVQTNVRKGKKKENLFFRVVKTHTKLIENSEAPAVENMVLCQLLRLCHGSIQRHPAT